MLLLQAHEPARLTALAEYRIVGSEREGAFDGLVRIARKRFDAPISAISFVDERRWWPKAISGFARCSLPRAGHLLPPYDRSTAAATISSSCATRSRDRRFADSPLVASGPRVRFYAGAPLRDSLGYALGTFSIFGGEPRQLGARDAASLREFARLAFQLLELRRAAGRADVDRAELVRVTRSLALLEALLSAVSEAADLSTALWSTAQRIGELTGWRVRSVWRPGDDVDSPLPAQASLERRAVLDARGAATRHPGVGRRRGGGGVDLRSGDARAMPALRDPSLLSAVAGVVQPLGALVRRRRIEEQLRASEMKLRSVTESARDGIVTLARDGTIVYANPAARRDVRPRRDARPADAEVGLGVRAKSRTGRGDRGGENGEVGGRTHLEGGFPSSSRYAEWTVDQVGLRHEHRARRQRALRGASGGGGGAATTGVPLSRHLGAARAAAVDRRAAVDHRAAGAAAARRLLHRRSRRGRAAPAPRRCRARARSRGQHARRQPRVRLGRRVAGGARDAHRAALRLLAVGRGGRRGRARSGDRAHVGARAVARLPGRAALGAQPHRRRHHAGLVHPRLRQGRPGARPGARPPRRARRRQRAPLRRGARRGARARRHPRHRLARSAQPARRPS